LWGQNARCISGARETEWTRAGLSHNSSGRRRSFGQRFLRNAGEVTLVLHKDACARPYYGQVADYLDPLPPWLKCVADDKKYLRQVIGECRSALLKSYVASASRLVQLRILESSFYRATSTIVLYAAKDNEVGTGLLLADAFSSRRRVLLPRVIPATHELVIVRVRNDAELVPGSFGLLEPMGSEIVPVANLGPALFCVPGVAFSRMGQRLGRGGGYFDRTLAAIGPQTVTAGLAYSFQLLDRLPESLNDRRLNLIFTESAMHAGQAFSRSNLAG
jgi:5-formyltetrahydrofolate cyclo-ligase